MSSSSTENGEDAVVVANETENESIEEENPVAEEITEVATEEENATTEEPVYELNNVIDLGAVKKADEPQQAEFAEMKEENTAEPRVSSALFSAFNKPIVANTDEEEKANSEIEKFAGGAGTKLGTGGMFTKIQAAKIAAQHGIIMLIINGGEIGNLRRALDGEEIGTIFYNEKE